MAADVEATTQSAPERILDAACDLIAAEGIDEVRIARVAQRAGASTALVHHYFSTREELLEQALIHSFEEAGDERFRESPDAEETATEGLARCDRRMAAVSGRPGARVGAVGRAVAPRRPRAGAAPGGRPPLRAATAIGWPG